MKLRSYQQTIYNNTIKLLEDNSKKFIMIQAPTGSGKSVLIYSLLQYLITQNQTILVITPRRELCDNIKDYFTILPPNIILETNLKKRDTIEKFDYIFIDEVHHAHCQTYVKKIQNNCLKNVIGFTATPKALYFEGFDPYYIPCPLDLKKLIEFKYLSDFNLITVNRLQAEVFAEARSLKNVTIRELTFSQLVGLIHDDQIKRVIDKCEGQTLIYCLNSEHTQKILKLCPEGSKVLTSYTPSKERELILNDFKQKKYHFLLSVNIFIEGLNIPSINNIIMLRPTESLVYYLQSIGRGLRIDPDNKEKKVNIYDFVSNIEYFGNPKDIEIKNPYKKMEEKRDKALMLLEPIISHCPYCKEEIKPFSKICPKCGLSIVKWKMNDAKRWYLKQVMEKIILHQLTDIKDKHIWEEGSVVRVSTYDCKVKVLTKNERKLWIFIFSNEISLIYREDLFKKKIEKLWDFNNNCLKRVIILLKKINGYWKLIS